MLIIDLLLALLLLGLTGYLIYSSYNLYSTTKDEGTKSALKQAFIIQFVQLFLAFGFLYTAVKTTAASPAPMY